VLTDAGTAGPPADSAALFFLISPKTIMTMPRLPTTPATCPTVRIMAAESFDFGAIVNVPKKNSAARPSKTAPTMTTRAFMLRKFSPSRAYEICSRIPQNSRWTRSESSDAKNAASGAE
jgi:hypothetical protein